MAAPTCIRLCAVALATVAVPHLVPAQGADPIPAEVLRAADSLLAIRSGGATGSGWPDLSDTTRARDQARIDAVAAMARALPDEALTSPAARLLADNVRETVEASIAARVCRSHLWAGTSQFSGWHTMASNAARVEPVASSAARDRALARFRLLPAQMAAERALLARGIDSGFTAGADVIQAVIRQLDDLLPEEVSRSPLYGPAQRDSSDEFRAAWRALLTDELYPAARAHRDYLANEYLPRARREGSLAHQKDGRACYAATLRAQTSVESNLDSLMQVARADLDRVATDLAPLARRLTGTGQLSDAIRQLRTDARFTFASRDSILAAYRAMTAIAAARFPRVVAGFAAESLAVIPYPEFQEKAGLPPQYLRAGENRPAQFLVNLSRTERMSVANAVAHEGYPGHHLQRIAEARAAVLHPVMRTLFVSGFSEGWGIYSERLADEMGLYVTELDRAGYLVHLLDVMVAAYLDVAYHTKGWTRDQLVDSMMVLGGRTKPNAEAYADRHAATPGQLATYYVGFQAISASRARAGRALGSAFSAPEFHREVLRDGTITLASLAAKVDRWIAQSSAARTRP